jgi:hypothetical protein
LATHALALRRADRPAAVSLRSASRSQANTVDFYNEISLLYGLVADEA